MLHPSDHSNVLIVRGSLSFVLGAASFYLHPTNLASAAMLWGTYAVLVAVIAGFFSFSLARRNREWKISAALSGVGVIAAIFLFGFAKLEFSVFSSVLGVWALLLGALDCVEAFRNTGIARSALAWIGFLSLAFGFVILKHPFAGSLMLFKFVGLYALVSGLAWTVLGFNMKIKEDNVGEKTGFGKAA